MGVQVFGHGGRALLDDEMAGGQLTGTGHVTVQSLDFSRGTMGGAAGDYVTGSTTVLRDDGHKWEPCLHHEERLRASSKTLPRSSKGQL